MSRLFADVKVATRTALRARFVSTLAVIAFALGIGVTTAVFSIFNGVLLEPLAYEDPGRLVMVYDTQPSCSTCPASFPKYHDWRERNQVFSAIGGSMGASFALTGSGDPLRVRGTKTTASLADVFGVRPQLGRWYAEDEDRPGGPKVVLISHGFWLRQLGADRSVLGHRLILDGASYEIIGVMLPSFTLRGADL